jgi:thioredoxin-like negative regulator of GroEL
MFEFIDIDAINYYKEAEEKVLFFFESPWCEKCESFISKVMTLPEEELSIPVYRIELDMDGGDYVSRNFDITETPTAILFSDGEEDKRTSNEDHLKDLII